MCRLHLDHIGYPEKTAAELEARIEAMMQPFRAARDLLMTIPGIAQVAAAAVISEIGPDPRQYFPAAAHLASWARPAAVAVPGGGERLQPFTPVHGLSAPARAAFDRGHHEQYLPGLPDIVGPEDPGADPGA